jgi:hypothetical protein
MTTYTEEGGIFSVLCMVAALRVFFLFHILYLVAAREKVRDLSLGIRSSKRMGNKSS